ncbi:PEP-CTERM sorting domain-containing protein [Aeoliella mucimassa]|uniref:Ice-binding protein C-terminal domain-containing protein n=1 Tax=Aeoliella mucimassa TaxID=2527972 RepID=A0A518AQS9_9BACT|nr:PEP-CTERM sorting domain-containing protein [Aeoliella mucimassa]QDU57077.1 hypothetical protein Pan181_32910 [Aeoliella mucimassa]
MSAKHAVVQLVCALMATVAMSASSTLQASEIVGDHNLDGVVDLGDYTIIIDNGLGDVSLDEWQSQFGETGDTIRLAAEGDEDDTPGPKVSVAGVVAGEQINWTATFMPDEDLYDDTTAGFGGSIAVSFSFEMPTGSLIASSVMYHLPFDTELSGFDPYTGDSIAFGTQVHPATTSVMGTGTVDAFFTTVGSDVIKPGDTLPTITFSTTLDGSIVTHGGIAAQAGMEFTIPPATSRAVPEPSTLVLAGMAVVALGVMSRRAA